MRARGRWGGPHTLPGGGATGNRTTEATIYPLNHVLRDYAWGSTTAIPELLGIPATGEPVAELWLGAHPDSPATILTPDGSVPLDEWIARHPDEALGGLTRAQFGARLPYLLKVLAARQALSLQVHPTSEQAAAGYAAEERAGVAHDARERRYKDPFHKPELVIALTPFHALCGLRPLAGTRVLLDDLGIDDPVLHRLRDLLDSSDDSACLRAAFDYLLGPDLAVETALKATAEAARGYLDAQPQGPHAAVASTTVTLCETYPADAGVLVSLLLNRLTLAPGEALYLPAGNVHAYLEGTGIEVMAASDNVLRAGLTPKYIDVPELLSVVDFHPRPSPYVWPEQVADGLLRFLPDVAEFAVAWAAPDGSAPIAVDPDSTGPGPRLVFCLTGTVSASSDTGAPLELGRGEAAFVPAQETGLRVAGTGTAVVVSVP